MTTRTPPRVVSAVLATLLLAATLSACSGGGSSSSAPTTTPTTPTTAAPATTAPCGGFRGTVAPLTSVGPTSPGLLVDAVAGASGCLDQVTFTFAPAGAPDSPGYVVGYQDPAKQPFLDGDPPTPIDLPGVAFLVVTMTPAASSQPSTTTTTSAEGDNSGTPPTPGTEPTYTGNTSLGYGDHHHLEIVRKLPDGKDATGASTVVWVIGLDGVRPFRVDRTTNPPRITVDIG